MAHTQTQTASNDQLARELYDMIMSFIEPDLVTEAIKTLETKYASETEEQKRERMARYEQAYKLYDEAFSKFVVALNGKVSAYRRNALQSAESKSKADEQNTLENIESSFQ